MSNYYSTTSYTTTDAQQHCSYTDAQQHCSYHDQQCCFILSQRHVKRSIVEKNKNVNADEMRKYAYNIHIAYLKRCVRMSGR